MFMLVCANFQCHSILFYASQQSARRRHGLLNGYRSSAFDYLQFLLLRFALLVLQYSRLYKIQSEPTSRGLGRSEQARARPIRCKSKHRAVYRRGTSALDGFSFTILTLFRILG